MLQECCTFLSGGVFFIWLVMRRKYAWSCFPNSSLDLTLANLMLKASGPSCNNSSHFLPIPFLTLRHMFSSRRGESGYTSSWSFKSRSISCLTNAFPSLLLLKFWGRACGNAGWMTSKKEYDGVQDNSISIQPNLGPLELFTCLENPRNQPKQRIWIPCIHMRWKVVPHEKVCPPRAHLFVGYHFSKCLIESISRTLKLSFASSWPEAILASCSCKLFIKS